MLKTVNILIKIINCYFNVLKETKNILDNYVRPEFKQENYYGGIRVGVESIFKVLGDSKVCYLNYFEKYEMKYIKQLNFYFRFELCYY